jgi:hypothetical protein
MQKHESPAMRALENAVGGASGGVGGHANRESGHWQTEFWSKPENSVSRWLRRGRKPARKVVRESPHLLGHLPAVPEPPR